MLILYSSRCNSCCSPGDSSFECFGYPHFVQGGFGTQELMIVGIQARQRGPSARGPQTQASGSDSSKTRPSPRNDSGIRSATREESFNLLRPDAGVGAHRPPPDGRISMSRALGASMMLHQADCQIVQLQRFRCSTDRLILVQSAAQRRARTLAVAGVQRRGVTASLQVAAPRRRQSARARSANARCKCRDGLSARLIARP